MSSEEDRQRMAAIDDDLNWSLLQLAELAGDDLDLWQRIEGLGAGTAERAVRLLSAELSAVREVGDQITADAVEPVMTLGKCGHVFTGTAGRYLCDDCE